MKRQSLEGAAVSGMSEYVLSPEQRALLTDGDVEGLLELHRSQFGTAVMEDDDENDDESEDDEDGDDSEDDADDDADGDEDEDGEDDDKAKGKTKKPTAAERREQELKAENKKFRLRSVARQKRIAALEAEVAELKRGKGKPKKDEEASDEDESQVDPEVTRKLEQANRANEDLLIRLEFMANNKHSWKNPKAALKLLDLSDVEINEDGEVEGLEEAIEELAKSEPYLLDKGTEEKDETKRRRRGATGQPTGGQRKGNPNRDKLISKYPALRR